MSFYGYDSQDGQLLYEDLGWRLLEEAVEVPASSPRGTAL